MYQVIVFSIGDQHFALDLNKVSSILEHVETTPIPNSHSVISGLINVRGEIFSVIDGGKLLGGTIDRNDSRIILLDVEQKLGLHVQNTSNVVTVEDVQPPSSIIHVNDSKLVKNVINHDGLILEISLDEVLNILK